MFEKMTLSLVSKGSAAFLSNKSPPDLAKQKRLQDAMITEIV
jgi:hypothetical protein